MKDQTISSIGTGFNHLKSNNRSFFADLYYHYSFGSGRSIALNVVNTFSNTQSENTISQVLPSPYEYLNYETNSLIKNRIYSLISNVIYKTKIFGGSFSIGSRYEYLKLSQKYMDEVFTPTTNNGFVYTSMSWSKNGMTFYPSMGLSIFYQKTSAGSNQFVLPYARIYSDWWGRGKFKGFTAQLTLNVNSIKPSSGQLTNSKTSLDRYFISIGNPGLKPYLKGSANLNLAYFQPDRNNSLILQYSANYSHRPFVSILKVEENETVYLQPQIIPQVISHDVALRGTWYPISWLEISPYVEYCNSSYRTPSQDVKLNYFRMGTTLGFHKDNWALVMTANSPTKTVSGDITIGGSAQYGVNVQYKYKDWSFGARWNYLGVNDYEMGKIARFEYKENKVWKPLRTMIQLTATWTFSKGRARRQASKMLNNSSIDDGLTEKNKPSTPM